MIDAATIHKFCKATPFVVVVFAIATLGGCAGAVIGGGAAVGTAAYQERGVQGVARDMATATRIATR